MIEYKEKMNDQEIIVDTERLTLEERIGNTDQIQSSGEIRPSVSRQVTTDSVDINAENVEIENILKAVASDIDNLTNKQCVETVLETVLDTNRETEEATVMSADTSLDQRLWELENF